MRDVKKTYTLEHIFAMAYTYKCKIVYALAYTYGFLPI